MPSAAADVPTETDVLCEYCGYGLNGLPVDSRCPECGAPIADSTVADGRVPAEWELPDRPALQRFSATTVQIIFRTSHFFRHLQTRHAGKADQSFAGIHRWIAAALFGAAAALHADWLLRPDDLGTLSRVTILIGFILATRLALAAIFYVASVLTRWEAAYRGYRMPIDAVQRAMNFHSAQLLPVSLIACATVSGYRALVTTHLLSGGNDERYLYVLCGEVVVCAMYLFFTYWAAMRNILYANR